MKVVLTLIKRNIKLFFKDKGMFLTALITPAILLVLYATFLSNVYRDSFTMNSHREYLFPRILLTAWLVDSLFPPCLLYRV